MMRRSNDFKHISEIMAAIVAKWPEDRCERFLREYNEAADADAVNIQRRPDRNDQP